MHIAVEFSEDNFVIEKGSLKKNLSLKYNNVDYLPPFIVELYDKLIRVWSSEKRVVAFDPDDDLYFYLDQYLNLTIELRFVILSKSNGKFYNSNKRNGYVRPNFSDQDWNSDPYDENTCAFEYEEDASRMRKYLPACAIKRVGMIEFAHCTEL